MTFLLDFTRYPVPSVGDKKNVPSRCAFTNTAHRLQRKIPLCGVNFSEGYPRVLPVFTRSFVCANFDRALHLKLDDRDNIRPASSCLSII